MVQIACFNSKPLAAALLSVSDIVCSIGEVEDPSINGSFALVLQRMLYICNDVLFHTVSLFFSTLCLSAVCTYKELKKT